MNYPMNNTKTVHIIQSKQATTRNLTQFLFIEVISISDEITKSTTATILHHNLFISTHF